MEYLSLYDYLGKVPGQDLGAKVDARAREQNVVPKQRRISNPKWYDGVVYLYPVDFLDEYFKGDMPKVKGDTDVSSKVSEVNG